MNRDSAPRSSRDASSRGAFLSSNNGQGQNDLLNRTPPYSLQAEQAVLAAMLSGDKDSIACVVDVLQTGEDFYDARHVNIYTAMLKLHAENKPLEYAAVYEQLRTMGVDEQSGGIQYLAQLAMAIVSSANAEHYAKIIRDRSVQRKLIATCSDIIGEAYPPTDDLQALLDRTEHSIFQISQHLDQHNFESTSVTVSNIFGSLSQMSANHDSITGVTTGFDALDRMTAGLQPSDLIIVAARPSMGKTAFALSMAVHAAMANVPVAIFSLEMSREQLVKRMLAIRSHVDLGKLRQPHNLTDEDWNNLYRAAETIKSAPIFIDDTATLSTLEFKARVRRLKSKQNIGLVIVDYLQLMHSPRGRESRELEISDISRTLKSVAKDINIPVVALSQLNRKVEDRSRDDKRPQLSDLRESGAIEQDADIIMFIYREDVYKFKNVAERPKEGKAEIIIGKQRNGPTGIAELIYLSNYTSFENMAQGWQPMVPQETNQS